MGPRRAKGGLAAAAVLAGAACGASSGSPGASPSPSAVRSVEVRPSPTPARGSSPVLDLVATYGDPPSAVVRIAGGALALERSTLREGPVFAGPFRPGTRTFLAVARAADGTFDLDLVDVDAPAEPRRLASGLRGVRWPVFSPDGRWLVFGGFDGTQPAIVRLRVDEGGGRPAVLASSPEGAFDPSISFDGTRVVYAASSLAGLRMVSVPLEGGAAREIPLGAVRFRGTPRCSPVEDVVAFVGDQAPGRHRVFLARAVEGGAFDVAPLSPGPGTRGRLDHLSFSPDGRLLAYVVAEAPAARVEIVRVADGEIVLRTAAGVSAQHPSFSPNADLIAVTVADDGAPALEILGVADGQRRAREPGAWLARFVPPSRPVSSK